MFEPIEKKCDHSINPIIAGEENIESPDIKREILDFINHDPLRPKRHSAHRLLFEFRKGKKRKRLVGFVCNCDEKTCHRIDEEGRSQWGTSFSQKQMNEIRGGVLVDFI